MHVKTFRTLALVAATLAAPRALAEDPLKIGALLAVSGPAAFLGAPEARTLQMLVDAINARGGVQGRKLQLIVKDTGASPEKAISFAKQLIEEEKVFAIIGPATSGETMAIKRIVEEGRTILLSCAAAEVIVQPVAPHVFKTAQKDSHAATRIFQQMRKMKLSRVGLLTSNTGFGKAGKEQIEKLAPEYGIRLVASEVYDKAATDLTAEVTKMKAAQVEAIINWSIEPAQAIAIKNIRQLGLTIPIFQSHGFANVGYAKAAGAAAEGVLFPAGRLHVIDDLPSADPQRKVLVAYRDAYESRFKEDASDFGGFAHDALLILTSAIEKVGAADREKVRTAIEGTRGLVGASGVFNFSPADHNGLAIDALEMLTVKNGRFVPLAR